jgi:hypothetical protein
MDAAAMLLVAPQQDMQDKVIRQARLNALWQCMINIDNLWFTLFNKELDLSILAFRKIGQQSPLCGAVFIGLPVAELSRPRSGAPFQANLLTVRLVC